LLNHHSLRSDVQKLRRRVKMDNKNPKKSAVRQHQTAPLTTPTSKSFRSCPYNFDWNNWKGGKLPVPDKDLGTN
jgi:hypothetical protein